MENLAPARPNGYRKLLNLSYKLYTKYFTKVFLLSLLLSLAVFVPRFISIAVGQDLLATPNPLTWNRIWILAVQIAALLLFIGIIWHAFCTFHGKKDKMAKDINVGLHKVFAVIVASILQNFIFITVALLIFAFQIYLAKQQLLFNNNLVSMLFTIFIFFGSLMAVLYMFTLFTFLIPLIATENKNVFAAIGKSMSLGWNHWWRIFSLQATPWILYIALISFLRYVFNINFHIYFIEPASDNWAISIAHMLLFAIFVPFVAATMVVQLHDLELRRSLPTAVRKIKRRIRKIRVPKIKLKLRRKRKK